MWPLLVFNMIYPITELIANEFDNKFEMFKYIFYILYLYDPLYIVYSFVFVLFLNEKQQ